MLVKVYYIYIPRGSFISQFPQDVRPLGAILVSGSHISSGVCDADGEKSLTFGVTLHGGREAGRRSMNLAAESPEDLGRWLNTLSQLAKMPEQVRVVEKEEN